MKHCYNLIKNSVATLNGDTSTWLPREKIICGSKFIINMNIGKPSRNAIDAHFVSKFIRSDDLDRWLFGHFPACSCKLGIDGTVTWMENGDHGERG